MGESSLGEVPEYKMSSEDKYGSNEIKSMSNRP